MNNKIVYFSFIGIICAIFSCGGLNYKIDKVVDVYVLEWNIPLVDAKNGVINILKDSCLIYYSDDLILFRTPYVFTQYSKTMQNGDTTTVLEDSSDFTEIRFKNFIYKNNSSMGLRYDSGLATRNTVFNVDSLLRKKAFKESKFYDSMNDILVAHKEDKKTGLVFEKYVPRVKFDESYNDTTYFVFDSKFKSINYSLSKEADSLKKIKLVEVKLSYNAKPKTANNLVEIPKRDFLFKIREVKINNPKEILGLFERFKKDSDKLNLK